MNDLAATVFYKAHFEIDVSRSGINILRELSRIIQNWLTHKNRSVSLWNWAQFLNYGEFRTDDRLVYAKSTSFMPRDDKQKQYWACRIAESTFQDLHAPREWVTEIGYEQMSFDKATFSYILYYTDKAGYIGEYMPPPYLTTPSIIYDILTSCNFRCHIGSQKLETAPVQLYTGDAPSFWDILRDPLREVPIIFIAPIKNQENSNVSSINVPSLANNTVGNANVYFTLDIDFLEELKYVFHANYFCYPGTVRIYMPHISVEDPNDKFAHRYISQDQIRSWGASEIVSILRRSLACDIRYYEAKYMFRMQDCIDLYKREQFLLLRDKLESTESIQSQIEEYKQLLVMADEERERLITKNTGLQENCDQYIARLQNQDNSINSLSHELECAISDKTYAVNNSDKLYRELQERDKALNATRCQIKLPKTQMEVVEYFLSIFPDCIAFTRKGINSVKNKCTTKPEKLWECLYSVVTLLIGLHRNGCSNIEAEYESQTNFDLARGESNETRKDKTLMQMRTDDYMGKTIIAERHVGYRSKRDDPNLLRIQYEYDKDFDKIIIVHCGEHLPVFST